MLTITHVNYIRELYFLEGKTSAEICRMTGRNYRTVRKYIEKEDFNEKRHKAERPNRTDELRPIIEKWLVEDQLRHRKQRHTAKRIYDRLKDEHPELLTVTDRTVRNIVREEKQKLYGEKDAHLSLHHPGGEAQVDFGGFEAKENGTLQQFYELVLSFPKSNAGLAVVTRSETREALLEGLFSIFKFTGYVPHTLWFDQMSAAALRSRDENGKVKTADFVLSFAHHYGFSIRYCNPDSGHEKGNVENKVGTIRRNLFVPEPTITNLEAFNEKLLEACQKRHRELHYRLKEPIETLFENEKAQMIPVNRIPFDTARYESRKVNKYGLIEFSGCRYSVSPRHVGQRVIVKVMANSIDILSKDEGKGITQHSRLFEKGTESIHYVDFIDVIKVRPNALKYSGIYSLLPASWQAYLPSLDKESFKNAFDVLRTILLEEDMDFADKVLKETARHESTSPAAMAITYKRLKENRTLYESVMDFPADLPLYEVDTSRYDHLMGGGQR